MSVCPSCGQEVAPPRPFAFEDMHGRHRISVSGVREPQRTKISIRCETCKESLLVSSDATIEQALAAVENHG